MAVWSTAFINDLPDSAFLYVEAGGGKDAQGKTVPRTLRHFPVRDPSGKPDAAHVRNALSRVSQSNIPAAAKGRALAAAQALASRLGIEAEGGGRHPRAEAARRMMG